MTIKLITFYWRRLVKQVVCPLPIESQNHKKVWVGKAHLVLSPCHGWRQCLIMHRAHQVTKTYTRTPVYSFLETISLSPFHSLICKVLQDQNILSSPCLTQELSRVSKDFPSLIRLPLTFLLSLSLPNCFSFLFPFAHKPAHISSSVFNFRFSQCCGFQLALNALSNTYFSCLSWYKIEKKELYTHTHTHI